MRGRKERWQEKNDLKYNEVEVGKRKDKYERKKERKKGRKKDSRKDN